MRVNNTFDTKFIRMKLFNTLYLVATPSAKLI